MSVTVAWLDPGTWSHCFGASLIDLLLLDAHTDRQVTSKLRVQAEAAGVARSRNEIAASFLDHTDSDWLWTIDSDMGFAPDTVARLLASADPDLRPVVGGLCFALRRDGHGEFYGDKYVVVPTVYDYIENDTDLGFLSRLGYQRDALTECAATGAACMLIHRSALEKVREAHGDCWYSPITHPRGVEFSEDLSLCVRLAAADVPIHVDTRVRTTHYKGGVYLDEDEYDRCRALHAVPADTSAA